MGSYDSAVMTGFICRVCSELNRNVIHIYSDKGRDLQLTEKLNLMPISVEPQDSLPKTVCQSCILGLDSHYRLIQKLRKSRQKILEHQAKYRQSRQETSEIAQESDSSSVNSETVAASTSNNTSE